MKNKAEFWINKLQLKLHPEGGYYKETYRSNETIKKDSLPSRYNANRYFSTAIYFLLKSNQVSKFHRLKSDEIWHYYAGSSLTIYIINPEGKLKKIKLGPDVENKEQLQIIIKKGVWFGAMVNKKNSYTLMGCTVAPGFDFKDFELGTKARLLKKFPMHKKIIEKL